MKTKWKGRYPWEYLNQIKGNKTSELVAFGNYILSRREEGMVSEINQYKITKEDLENFKVLKIWKQEQ